MRNVLLTVGLSCCLYLLVGCGDGGFKDDGIAASDKAAAASANATAVSVDGNFDKLTPEQKKQFMDLAGGSEGQARRLVNMMAHPPIRGSGGAAPGPAMGPHPPGGTGN